jgi:hypothetical protein
MRLTGTHKNNVPVSLNGICNRNYKGQGGSIMEDATATVEEVLFREVLTGGTNLTVIATRIAKEQWQLSVQNEYGINSNWLEFFPSAELAIDAGLNAIEKEGIEPFIDTEGFEYLFEL